MSKPKANPSSCSTNIVAGKVDQIVSINKRSARHARLLAIVLSSLTLRVAADLI
jgi:hypothetical protein